MANAAFAVAFVLMWAYLLSLGAWVVDVARKEDRGDPRGPRGYGL